MKLFLLLGLITTSFFSAPQKTYYQVPKYSPSYKRTTRDLGPKPGSKAPSNAQPGTFKRIYSRPAGMRLLVRANCSTRINRAELISRARKLSTPDGPVVQIDWEPVGNEVAFWAVASANRKITEVDLEISDGKYKAVSTKTVPQEHWEVQKLVIGEKSVRGCVDLKELKNKDLKVAVTNFLNKFSVSFFRRPSTQFASNP